MSDRKVIDSQTIPISHGVVEVHVTEGKSCYWVGLDLPVIIFANRSTQETALMLIPFLGNLLSEAAGKHGYGQWKESIYVDE